MATVTFGSASTSSSNTDTYAGAAFTPAVDDLIVVWVGIAGSVAASAGTDATDDQGGTYTLIDTASRASDAHHQALLVRDSLVTSAVSHTVTVTVTGDAGTGALIHCYRIAGMSKTGAAAVLQTAKQDNQGSGGTPAPAFASSALTGNVTMGAVSQTAAAAMTEPTGWTEGADNTHAAPNQGYESVFRNSGFTGTTITWGSTTSGTFSSLIAEFDTSASGDTVTGIVLSASPSLPAAALRVNITGAVLSASPSLPAATLQSRVTGQLLQVTPSLPAASIEGRLPGAVLQITPSLPVGSLRSDVTGVVLAVTPTLPAANLSEPDQITAAVLSVTPTLPAGVIVVDLNGTPLSVTPTLPAGSLQANITGTVLQVTPTLPAGNLQDSVIGVVLQVTPTLPAGSVRAEIIGVVLSANPTLPAAGIAGVEAPAGVGFMHYYRRK